MKKRLEKINIKKFEPYIIILIISVIFVAPLLTLSTSILGHDSPFHISNLLSLKATLSTGNWLFPKIYPIIARGFGYATGIFYGPIPHLGSSVIAYILSFLSVTSVMKIIHFITILFSMVFMYNFVYKISKKKYVSLVAAVIYVSFPYFLSDIYVRDSYAESISFVFIPLIFNGLYELIYLNNNKNFYKLFIPGVICLFLTHTITTFYTAIFVLIFIILNFKKVFNKKNITSLLISLIFVLGVTAFYYVPIIEQKLFADIHIFNVGSSSSASTVASYALGLYKLFPYRGNQSSDGVQFFFLIPTIILLTISIINFKSCNLKNKKIFSDFAILGFLSLFMSTKLFPWSKMPSILLFIQFPWRLLLFSDFFLSIFAVLSISDLKPNFEKVTSLIIIILLIMSSTSSLNLEKISSYNENDIDISIFGVGAVQDYLPQKVVDNYDYYINRDSKIKILSGSGSVKILSFTAPYISFQAEVDGNSLTMELPLLYYYGYNTNSFMQHYYDSINDSDNEDNIDISESNNGFVQVTINESETYYINFTGSYVSKVASMISAISLVFYIVFINRNLVEPHEEKK